MRDTWMQIMINVGITEFEIIALFEVLLASLCGGLIGLERELKGRPAGLKTFSLVCIGSALAMITNEYININRALDGDITRMAAQVISGIGFLGAGTIMVTGHNKVQGLTTAATLWVTAAIGLAIGSGFYFGGIICVIVIYVSSFIYRWIDRKIVIRSRIMRIYVEGKHEEFMLHLIQYFEKNSIKVLNLQRKPQNGWYSKDTCAIMELDFGRRYYHQIVIDDIKSMDGLRYVEEI